MHSGACVLRCESTLRGVQGGERELHAPSQHDLLERPSAMAARIASTNRDHSANAASCSDLTGGTDAGLERGDSGVRSATSARARTSSVAAARRCSLDSTSRRSRVSVSVAR